MNQCPEVANPTQADEDDDRLGDLCDNCPLLENTRQHDEDEDDIGDICDPHPVGARDCLVLYDSFANAATFATNWEVEGNATTTVDQTQPGSVGLEDLEQRHVSGDRTGDRGRLRHARGG